MNLSTVIPEQKQILDLTKFEKLLEAERLTIEHSKEQGNERAPFLAYFLRDVENNPSALNYFTRGTGDASKNARAMVQSLDLSNIKNEVLTAIYLFYTKANEWRACFPYQNSCPTITPLSTGREDEISYNILYTTDTVGTSLFQHLATCICMFDHYLINYPDKMSMYITAYLDSFIILNKKSRDGVYFYGSEPKTWNYYSSYSSKEVESFEKILSGKKSNPILSRFVICSEPEFGISKGGVPYVKKIRR